MKIVTLCKVERNTLVDLLGEVLLYQIAADGVVSDTLRAIERVWVTPPTRGEGWVLNFPRGEFDILYWYLAESLHQGYEGDGPSEGAVVRLAKAFGQTFTEGYKKEVGL